MIHENNLSLRDWMSEAGVTKWILTTGVTNSHIPRSGVKSALRFFNSRMPALKPSMALNFLLAMDLSRNVNEVILPKGKRVIAFRKASEDVFKLFYTRPGESIHRCGINDEGRAAVHYTVINNTPALQSYTTGTVDVWSIPATDFISIRTNSTGRMVLGGGIQLIIPNARHYLQPENNPKRI